MSLKYIHLVDRKAIPPALARGNTRPISMVLGMCQTKLNHIVIDKLLMDIQLIK